VILAAALLVLLGLGLFVGGILTGATILYWLCVAACVAAGVCLVLARARMSRAPAAPTRRSSPVADRVPATSTADGPSTGATAVSSAATPVSAPTAPDRADDVAPVAASLVEPPAAPAWERTVARAWEPAAATAGESAAVPAEHERTPAAPVHEPAEPPSTAAHAPRTTSGVPDPSGEPPVEEVEVTDLLVVVDLRDEVLVVDEHPRYHLGGCRWLAGRETFPLPLDEARTDGFTPCAWCEPDRTLAQRERGRRSGRSS
jgi:hypothetical protein